MQVFWKVFTVKTAWHVVSTLVSTTAKNFKTKKRYMKKSNKLVNLNNRLVCVWISWLLWSILREYIFLAIWCWSQQDVLGYKFFSLMFSLQQIVVWMKKLMVGTDGQMFRGINCLLCLFFTRCLRCWKQNCYRLTVTHMQRKLDFIPESAQCIFLETCLSTWYIYT